MLIVGYCFGIRSERRRCEEVQLNLAYRWFCRLGLDGDVQDHSTFSKTRHGRFRDADLLRELFETVVRRCMAEGLVGGEGFAVDSMIMADAHRQRGVETPDQLDPKANRAVTEYLATLDDAAFGAAIPVEPKLISPVDPAARWTASCGGPAVYAYCSNYLVDVQHAVIVDVEPSTAVRQTELAAAKTMIERVHDDLDLWPERLIADTGYGAAEMLNWLVNDRGIEPTSRCSTSPSAPTIPSRNEDFVYDHASDTYRCPGGKILRRHRREFTVPRIGVMKDNSLRYRASKHDCEPCPLKPRCCPNAPARKVPRSISRVSASPGNGQTAAASGSSQIFGDGGNGVSQIDSTATAIAAGSGASHAQVDMNFSGISTSRADLVFGSVAATACCAPLAEAQVGVTGKTGGAYARELRGSPPSNTPGQMRSRIDIVVVSSALPVVDPGQMLGYSLFIDFQSNDQPQPARWPPNRTMLRRRRRIFSRYIGRAIQVGMYISSGVLHAHRGCLTDRTAIGRIILPDASVGCVLRGSTSNTALLLIGVGQNLVSAAC